VASSRGATIGRCLAPLALAAAVAWTFAPALGAGFVSYDDTENLIGNAAFRGLDAGHLEWMFRTGWMGHYQPLTWVSLALDSLRGGAGTVGGLDPAPFHATNVALHVLAALAVYLLARRLLELRGVSSVMTAVACSAVAALLFALHPLRVESVAWVTERRDVLSAPFFVLAVWCWLKRGEAAPVGALRTWRLVLSCVCAASAVGLFLASVDRGRAGLLEWGALGAGGLSLAMLAWGASVALAASAAPSRARWQAAASAALALISLGAKAWGIVLPAVLLVCDAWPLRRSRGTPAARAWAALAAEKAPFLALSAIFGVLASWAQASQAATLRSLADHGLAERAAQAFYGLWFYPSRTLAPHALSPIYELPRELSLGEPRFLVPMLLVLAITAVLIALRRRCPAALTAWVAFAAIVSPVLGVLQSGPQLVADRYTYLATIPFALLAGGGLAWVLERAPRARIVSLGLALCVVGALALASRAQTRFWIDSERLWSRAVAVQPQSAMAHLGLGYVRLEQAFAESDPARRRSALETAGAQFEQGIEHGELPRLFSNLALVESSLADLEPERAAERTARAVQLSARSLELAEERGGAEPELYLSHAVQLAHAGRNAEALPYFEAFVRDRPDDVQGHLRLASLLLKLDRKDDARRALERALALDPSNSMARETLRALGG
jgi:protein O-mannosyl-transferase